MKMYVGEVAGFIKLFYETYLVERDVDKTVSFLGDCIQWVGTGSVDVVKGKNAVEALLRDEIAKDPVACELVFLNVSEQIMDNGWAAAFLELELLRKINGILFRFHVRVTAGIGKIRNENKIVSIHASIVDALQEGVEYFPAQTAEEAESSFESRINYKSQDLLSKNIPGGIIGGYVEEDGPLYYVNQNMLEYLGYTSYREFEKAIDGKTIHLLHPDDRERVYQILLEAFRENREFVAQYRMPKKDGGWLWVNGIGKKGVAEDGRPVCLTVVRDITAEIRANDMLQAKVLEAEGLANRYDKLFQSLLCGIVQYRIETETDVVFKEANREAIRIFGYTQEAFWAKASWNLLQIIAEEDRLRVMDEIASLKEVGNKKSFEYRFRRADGSLCWIVGSAEVIGRENGKLLLQSVFMDIDAKKRMELRNQRLAEQIETGNQLLEMALKHTVSMREFYYYPQKRLVINPERTRQYYHCGERYGNMPGSFASQFVAEESRQAFIQMYEKIHKGQRTASAEFKLINGDVWCRCTLSSISAMEEGQAPFLAVGIVEDISKEKSMESALKAAREKDRLTGLYTKESGLMMVRQYMENRDQREDCLLMLLDMDDFARINKEEGTVFADAILQDIADILRAETKPEDICIRLGGDEFMVFVKDCGKPQARVIGTRIAKSVKSLYGKRQQRIPLSVSIGMCVTSVVNEYNGLYRCSESVLLYVKKHTRGIAACYMDVSDEVGMALTKVYTEEHAFNEIDSQTAYNKDMIDFALDLLGKAKKLDDAIFLLLARIGNRYGFDRVSIFETNPEYLAFRYTYQWAKDRAHLNMGKDFYFERETYQNLSMQYDDEGLCDHPVYSEYRIGSSALQAAFWNQGIYAGGLCFEVIEADRSWTEEERKVIKEVAKLVSSFIMKARADAGSRAKTEFLSRMSHEIRTPMNAISGMTTIAKNVLDDKHKTLECLNKIESANRYLLGLINDILDMSRIESGKVELNYESTDLSRQMQKLEALLKPQAQEKGVNMAFHVCYQTEHYLMMDVLRLQQVMINLIGNAIKFTPRGGHITVAIDETKRTKSAVRIRFSIADTGIGIAKQSQERIFNVFEQGQKDTSLKYGGTGLGLSISSRLIRMMGGRLKVESEVGKGAEFYFELPVSFGERQLKNVCSKEQEAEEAVIFADKRILLVEDNDINLEIAVEILKMYGFIVETAVNGKEAVELFVSREAGTYQAILMDIRMPVMDGLEATRSIRTSGKEDARQVPIIAMTANAFDDDTKKSIESGMNSHLSKPIDVKQLLKVLKSCL